MDTVFAILKPSNIHARLDFHAVVERFYSQHRSTDDARSQYIEIEAEQIFDESVSRFRRRELASLAGVESDVSSDSSVVSDASGMIWTGHYKLDIRSPPQKPEFGWRIGKSEDDVDFMVGVRGGDNDIRGLHAMFNFHHAQTGFISIRSRSTRSGQFQVNVNGETVPSGQTHSLNESATTVRLGMLQYDFVYTSFASELAYFEQRKKYFTEKLGTPAPFLDFYPTPKDHAQRFGPWTLNIPLGKGSFGKVHSASNSNGLVVAVKVMDWSAAKAEISILEELRLLKDEVAEQHLVRLIEIIDPNTHSNRSIAPFRDLALVLEPCVSSTFETMTSSNQLVPAPWTNARLLYRQALAAVAFLHDHGYVHGDLKPSNIGIFDGSRAVLLDMGGTMKLKQGHMLDCTPGHGGTRPYLAPERELRRYDHSVDVWSMGVILFELIYRVHPFIFAVNPWRSGNETLRPRFHEKYNEAYGRIAGESRSELKTVRHLLMNMLRHDWAVPLRGRRITAREAVDHYCWSDEFNDEQRPQGKKRRTE